MSQKLNIVICGAGIGGLALALALSQKGHRVTVLEASPTITELGAGIQVTPNFTRILCRLGLSAPLESIGVLPPYLRQVRWENGKTLTQFAVNADNRMESLFGYKYYHVHRKDLHKLLHESALEHGAKVLPNKRVVEYEHSDTGLDRLWCADGTAFEADLVVGADGARSLLADVVVGEPVQSVATGDSAYRALLPAADMEDREFASLELRKYATTWLGPDRHVVSYYVCNGAFYNIVVLIPDEPGEESWKKEGDMENLRKQFEGWDPRIQKMLKKIDKSYVWKLRDRPALKRWVHPVGNLVLLGDAAHPMLPYIAQGAASAVEDAAALATCLDFLENGKRSLREVLKVYENLRVSRTMNMRDSARANKDYFHLPDGPRQVHRDEALAIESQAGSKINQLNDIEKLKQLYEYDVMDEVVRFFSSQNVTCTL